MQTIMNLSFSLGLIPVKSIWRSTPANRKHLQLAWVSFYLARRSKRKELWADMSSSISLNPLTLRLRLFPIAGTALISMNQLLKRPNQMLQMFLFLPLFILVHPVRRLAFSHARCLIWKDKSVKCLALLPPLSHLRCSHLRWHFAASPSE